ncbi:hypothetical protein HDV57DRAFT_360684 [Trichoderma longibrachiatum]
MCRGSRVLGLRLAMWLEPGFARLLSSQSAAGRRGTACTEYGQSRTYRGQPDVGHLGVGSRMMDAIIVSLAFDFPVHGCAGWSLVANDICRVDHAPPSLRLPRYEPSGMVVFTSVCPREASRHTHGLFVWGTANHKPGSMPGLQVRRHAASAPTLCPPHHAPLCTSRALTQACVKMHGRGGDTLQRAASVRGSCVLQSCNTLCSILQPPTSPQHRLTGHAPCTRNCAQLQRRESFVPETRAYIALGSLFPAFHRPLISSKDSTT